MQEMNIDNITDIGGWQEDKKTGDENFDSSCHYINPELIKYSYKLETAFIPEDWKWISALAVGFPQIQNAIDKNIWKNDEFQNNFLEFGGGMENIEEKLQA
jgi:hypothetical protein